MIIIIIIIDISVFFIMYQSIYKWILSACI